MEFLDLPPAARAAGIVRLPGSKSITNRALLLAALAGGVTVLDGVLESDDTRVMLEALRALGVQWEAGGDGTYRVAGVDGAFPVKDAALFVGNSGTSARSLVAALAFCAGTYRIDGVARMRERPIRDLVDALRQAGSDIVYEGNDGFFPLKVGPGTISLSRPISIRGDVSSQFLTGLLQALPLGGKPATVEVDGELISKPYIAITLELMGRFGVKVERSDWSTFHLDGKAHYRSPGRLLVEGDASGASYFLAAGAISGARGGGPVRVLGVGAGSIQGDIAFADALALMGASVVRADGWIEAGAGTPLCGVDFDCVAIPDAAMTLAIVAMFAAGPTMLRGIGSWRVKETDRIAAMAAELRKVGAQIDEGPDWLRITPPAQLRPASIATYDDHRMAMCFSLVSLGGVAVRINDPGCVSKTYPGYFADFKSITVARMKSRRAVPVIAIDGPTASGKGTVAAEVAAALGFHYLDSGALYRIVGLAAIRAGQSLDDPVTLAGLAAQIAPTFVEGRIIERHEDITGSIRSEEVSRAASQCAVFPDVRQALLERQHAFRRPPGLVADGRDMGSVVFPDATLKVYLTASLAVRAERRHKQLIEKGIPATIEGLLRDLQERDTRDSGRVNAPLAIAADALVIDTTAMGIADAVAAVIAAYRERR